MSANPSQPAAAVRPRRPAQEASRSPTSPDPVPELSFAIDELQEGFMLFDSDDRLVLCNERMHQLFPGGTPTMVPGVSATEFFRGVAERRSASPEEAESWLARRLEFHRRATGETVERIVGGRLFQVTVSMTPGGYRLATYHDITDLRRHERETAREAGKLRAVLENMSQGVVVIDNNLTIVASNQRAVDLLDLPADLLTPGADYRGVLRMSALRGDYGPGDPEDIVARIVDRVPSREPERFERRLPNGQIVGVRVAVIPGMGKIITFTNITGRRRAEHQLRLTQYSIDRVSDCAFWTLRDGRLAGANDTACRKLGYERDALLNLSIFDVCPEITREQWTRIWVRVAAGASFTRQMNLRNVDGGVMPAEISASFVQFDGKEYVCAFARDITERMASEERLRHSQKMEALGQLAGGMAHEFNNVLTSVLGFARLAMKKPGDATRVSECLTEVVEAAQRASELTKQMLTFGRKQILEPKVLRAGELVRGLEKLFRTLIEESYVLDWAIDDETLSVEVDPNQLSQCVINLVINARHAMPDGGSLQIGVRRAEQPEPFMTSHGDVLDPGSYACIFVRDTGTGIDRDTLQHIFEPFFTTKAAGKGTGLGLSLVYGMVRNSGGTIHVDTEVGVGTTFALFLPLVDAAPTAEAVDPPATDVPVGNRETILLVEDEAPIRRLVTGVLEQLDYRVVSAANGVEALRVFANDRDAVDLVITDVIMPEMDGLQLARQLNQQRPDLKVIYMTGYAPELTDHLAKLSDNITLLRKPFAPDALARLVRTMLQRSTAAA
jgi:PAS domain S-box-containing protein